MKKLIAILLVLACMLVMGACSLPVNPPANTPTTNPPAASETQDILDALDDLIRTSAPTQSKVVTLTGSKYINLKSELTITMGELSGKEAALYVHEYESLNDVGDTAAITRARETKEYVEGMGLRVDGGFWETEQPSFVRRLMPYRMSLEAKYIKSLSVNADKTEFSFIIPMDNASDVLTNFDAKTIASINSDISVNIKTDGSAVTFIGIVYNTKNVSGLESPKVEVKAEYSYDLQSITLLK